MTEETSSRAIVAFIFGLLGITQVLPCVGPLVAILVGAGETSGLGRAGVIMGWITFALYALGLLILLGFVVFAIGIEAMN